MHATAAAEPDKAEQRPGVAADLSPSRVSQHARQLESSDGGHSPVNILASPIEGTTHRCVQPDDIDSFHF